MHSKFQKSSVVTRSFAIAIALATFNSQAQTINVPQTAAYTQDVHTVLLEHFNGSTTGTPNGSVTYPAGKFGKGVRLNDSSWVSWNLGALSQGTVEFWGYLDTLTNAANDGGGIRCVHAYYSPFYADVFTMSVFTPLGAGNKGINANKARSEINAQAGDWFGTFADTVELPSSAIIRPARWHHYAVTWGSQGYHFYVDGTLVFSNAVTKGLNTSTQWWCIGNQLGRGFNGVMDELRISNIQRVFKAVPNPLGPQVKFVRAFTLDYSNLKIGATYQVQVSPDSVKWTNWGDPFVATSTTYTGDDFERISTWNNVVFRIIKK